MRLAFGLALLVLLSACDTVSDSVDAEACRASGYAGEGTVSATVAGARYATPCVRGDFQQGVLVVASVDGVVSANAQRAIALSLPGTTPGTFTIGADAAAATFVARADDPSQQPDVSFAATSGTLTLSSVSDTAATGQFSFTARNAGGDEVEVTGGRFDVTF